MCKVKEGKFVVSNADLQNLVTSEILRQTTPFSTDDICAKMQAKLQGSSFQNSPEEVKKRCEATISTLYLIDCLKVTSGGYYKLSMTFPAIAKSSTST